MEARLRVLESENSEMKADIAELQELLGESHRNQKKFYEEICLLKKLISENEQGVMASAGVPVREPEPYDGTRDDIVVDDFLWDMNEYLDCCPHLPESEKVAIAASYLKDHAKTWWRLRKMTEASGGVVKPCETWEQMQEALRARFRPGNSSWLARDELTDLKHTGSIEDYISTFSSLMLKIQDMGEKDKLYHFTKGLQPWAQKELLWHNVDNIDQAIKAVDILRDIKTDKFGKKGLQKYDGNGSSQNPHGGKPWERSRKNRQRAKV